MRYLQIYIHGYLEFFMFDGTNHHLPEFGKNKPVWIRTVVDPDRVLKMQEVVTDKPIFDYIATELKSDPLRVKITEYKKSIE